VEESIILPIAVITNVPAVMVRENKNVQAVMVMVIQNEVNIKAIIPHQVLLPAEADREWG
jgi:hypothetical protein